MEKSKVIVYRKIPTRFLEKLQKHCDVAYFEEINEQNHDDFNRHLANADGLLGSTMKITNEILDRAPQLRVVSNFSAGYDNLPIDELTERRIIATNAPDALTDTTADMIFGLLLTASRRISELDRYIRAKKWHEEITESEFGLDVHHKTVGIVGMGRIGRAVAKRAALGFDMKVLYHKRTRDEKAEKQYGASYCGLSELLQSSDFVCLTIPLTSETFHLIGEAELNLMKKSAILINGARGAVVDQVALIQSLKNGTIFGAGLDVFEQEPLEHKSELLSMENVVLLPHIGSATKETRSRMVDHGIKNLQQALQGETPMNLLNPSVLETDGTV
ncbi:bifunctional glyoxylate/hydroxypyruvate reductase B [Bacillus sp. M6-12]|uniref:2-hydroxyacid dehydrogenase n=1 Tax=Bacillus sp. M6-12 TaxID=2054166 RepID=UPI000C778523|nr:D-glycerate dehydrogenase [Bacillus sp. M6-12]PLS18643.1 bifunctional glyoxylate/hydroxypyruvate reductase B [Bacillus sp. M6-12]